MSAAITDISLTDVRCFSGEQRGQLAKITLLVGENSVGKTTFMGCLNALGRLAGLDELDDRVNGFDQAPFSMGSFNTIARSGSDKFQVGLELADGPFSQFAIEFAQGAEVCPTEMALDLRLSGSTGKPAPALTITREAFGSLSERWRFDGPAFRFSLNQSEVSYVQFSTWLSQSIRKGVLPFSGERTHFRKRAANTTDRDLAAFGRFVNFFRHEFRAPENPLRIEPIRPHGLPRKRLYTFNPLGKPDGGQGLDAIAAAGSELELFEGIAVRQHHHGAFEILVDRAGSLRNLVDVGYGVSSLLPLLATLAGAEPKSLFLLQQPEVHIHPSAQAKLIEMMARSDHAFVMETHSDHVIRWARILVKEELLSPSDVSIIYFEPCPDDPSATRLHQISLDRRANLSGQPRSYRGFFSEETARLLGLAR